MKNHIILLFMLTPILTNIITITLAAPLTLATGGVDTSLDNNHLSPYKAREKTTQINPFGNYWDFSEIDNWMDSVKIDNGSLEIVIGVNYEKQHSYSELKRLIDENNGKLVDTISINNKTIAIVTDIPLAVAPSFTEKARTIGLSRYIEPNLKFEITFIPNDPKWDKQWGPAKIEADWAWNTTTGSPTVLVAVIDTGIDWDHPDLAANYVPLGYDWVNNDTDPMDDEGHGTHCAGIVAAEIDNGIGIAGVSNVSIMAEKGISREGWGTEVDLANGVIHAVDQGADILSLSWGGYTYSILIHEAIKYAYNHSVLVIASAGNEETSQTLYPAGYDEVIAVSATKQDDGMASFTNFGSWIELAAPGVEILSTYWNDLYLSMDGTSMSCPHVAGVAALAWSEFPHTTRDWIRIWLQYTADDLGNVGFDNFYGYGRVNARRAVEESPPEHDVLVSCWEKAPYIEPENQAVFNMTVLNFGSENEVDMTVKLLVNGTSVDSATIDSLEAGTSTTVSCSWMPTVTGVYNVTAHVLPVSGETRTKNNVAFGLAFVGIKTIRVPTHFPTIQEAIDFAGQGFTILVDSGIYVENLVVDKSLSLVGENTSIAGFGRGMVIHIIADNTNITGFMIQKSAQEWPYSGVLLENVSNCSVNENILRRNGLGILLWGCFNCSIFDNVAETNYESGIQLCYSHNCSIFDNTADQNSDYGIWLNDSSGCRLVGNSLTRNFDYGVYLNYSCDNQIYHNNFVSNSLGQAFIHQSFNNSWDNDYPSGGNHWSDYTGEDHYHGPEQNLPGNDGIGDTPYDIDENNTDRYPLMFHDIAVTNVKTSETSVVQGLTLTITTTVINEGDYSETFNVTAYANTTPIQTENVTSLLPGSQTIITFTWNTTSFSLGDYIISGYAAPVSNETETDDNIYSDGVVRIVKYPVAYFTFTPKAPVINEPITFNATLSSPNGGEIISYEWNFDDGNTNVTFTPIINHTYTLICRAYNVTLTVTDSEGLSDNTWQLVNVTGGEHDVAVTNIACKHFVHKDFGALIDITVENHGCYTENFNVTVYVDSMVIGTQNVTDLPPASETTLTFVWDTSSYSKDELYINYTISAYATQVSGETDIADNTYTDGEAMVVLTGDANGDQWVDMTDIGLACLAYGSEPGDPKWDPRCDVNDDNFVDMTDIGYMCLTYGEHV